MERIESLLNYDLSANQKVLKELIDQQAAAICPEAIRHFSHLVRVQQLWYNRIEGVDEQLEVWPDQTTDQISEQLMPNYNRLRSLLSKRNEIINYRNTKGEEYSNTVDDILHHVVIHGQHHRAQIAILMRQCGLVPPPTDYIFYLRGRK